jgi:hypothetical protein
MTEPFRKCDETAAPIPYYWWWKSKLPERRGHPCWVTARGAMNTIRVDFLDGFFVFTSRYAVRKVPVW